MPDIIEEEKLETRYENLTRIYKKSLPIIFTLCFFTCVFYSVYYNSKIKKERYSQEGFIKILDAKESDSMFLLDISNKNTKHQMSGLLVLSAAKLYLADKNFKKAAQMFTVSIGRSHYLPPIKAYAKLMWISVMLDLDEIISEEDKALAEEYFSSFSSNRDCFFDYANILKALWLIKLKNNNEAKILLQNIFFDNNVNPASRNQAKIIFQSIQ